MKKTFELLTNAVLITRVEAESKEDALKVFNDMHVDDKFNNSIPYWDKINYRGSVDDIEEIL